MKMIAFTLYSFAIMSFAIADPLPQGKVLISTIIPLIFTIDKNWA